MKELFWDIGTTYDLFVSLNVLNHPVQFGLRPSWAAGVRSRLPVAQRQFMESLSGFFRTPLAWIHDLPVEAKSAAEGVSQLQKIPSASLLTSLTLSAATPLPIRHTLESIAQSHRQPLLRKHSCKRTISWQTCCLKMPATAWSMPGRIRLLLGMHSRSC